MADNDKLIPTSEEAAESLKRIVDSLVTMLKFCGITEEQFSGFVQTAYREVDVPENSPSHDPSLSKQQMVFYGSLLSMWYQDPEFVDDHGDPRALPMHGVPSMTSLLKKAVALYPEASKDANLEYVIRRLVEAGAIEERSGEYHILEPHFRINTPGSVAAINQIALGAEYIETCAHNTTTPKEKRRFQRIARGPSFPVEEVPRIKALLEDQGMNLLLQLDGMLENPEKGTSVDVDRAMVAVGLYLTVKEPNTADE